MNSCYTERVAAWWGFRGVLWTISVEEMFVIQIVALKMFTLYLDVLDQMIHPQYIEKTFPFSTETWAHFHFKETPIKTTLWRHIFWFMSVPRIASRGQLVRILGCNLRADPLGFLSLTSSPIPSCVLKLCYSFLVHFHSNITTTPPSQKSNCSPAECCLQLSQLFTGLCLELPDENDTCSAAVTIL